VRTLLAVAGLAAVGYGAWRLLDTQDTGQVALVVVWLAAGVLAHDVVVAPLEIGLGRLGRALSGPVAAGAAVVLVVLGPATLTAIPVLGRFGADPLNPTLLDRDYALGWLLLAAAALLAGTAVAVRGLRSRTDGGRSAGGQDPGRR
jgi:hypothetical protein